MLFTSLVAASFAGQAAAETVLGVYMFHRHGDRTSKSTPPTNLTDLGFQEVYTSGNFFRNQYIASNATKTIHGIEPDLVRQAQIAVSAPSDVVLQNSATGFLQGLYPPVGDALGSQTLRNGTNITAPMQGYQLIPISLVSSGSGGEGTAWLQASTGCAAATVSSNEYFSSTTYQNLLNSTQNFYTGITPVINGTFNSSQISYQNAYTIFDLVNVAQIHNITNYNNSDLITDDVFFQLRTLADQHEWNLAYNASNNVRAIAGMTFAAQVVQAFNTTITGSGKSKINIQFGNYAVFASFFGLSGLQYQNPDFYGVSDYASVMSFELVTNATVSSAAPIPAADELAIRFYHHNGTTSDISPPVEYPLFNATSNVMSWNDFVTNMAGISVGTTEQWCTTCQNTTGTCAAYAPSSSSGSSSSSTQDEKSGNGLSPAVNGVIGAVVTLAVILGLEALILLVGGLRVVSKKRLAGGAASAVNGGAPKA